MTDDRPIEKADRKATSDWGLIAEMALRWWWGELSPLIPSKLRALFAPIPVVCRVLAANGDTTTRGSAPHVDFGQPTGDVGTDEGQLWIDPALIYSRRIELPLVTHFNLKRALGYEYRRYCPLALDLAYCASRVEARDLPTRRARANIFVVRRSVVDHAVQMAAENGLSVMRLCTEWNGAHIDLGLFPTDHAVLARFSRRQRLTAIRAMAVAVLVMLAIASPLIRLAVAQHQVDVELAAAETQAVASSAKRTALNAMASQVSAINAARAKPGLAAILADLAEALPDDVWLSRVALDGNTVSLHGYARNASAIPELLLQSKILSSPHFVSPILHSSQNASEEFEIKAGLHDAS